MLVCMYVCMYVSICAYVYTYISTIGIMALPTREETEDGFEKQIGESIGHWIRVHLALLLLSMCDKRLNPNE